MITKRNAELSWKTKFKDAYLFTIFHEILMQIEEVQSITLKHCKSRLAQHFFLEIEHANTCKFNLLDIQNDVVRFEIERRTTSSGAHSFCLPTTVISLKLINKPYRRKGTS